MRRGRIYAWGADGRVIPEVRTLPRLGGPGKLCGRFVEVRNVGAVLGEPMGDAVPDAAGDFLFEPGRGGGRMDKADHPDAGFIGRYVQAAHFGEVNAYFHIDRIAAYLDLLLRSLGASPLPRVRVLVYAHDAQCELGGLRDGVEGTHRWLPFQGGHYRLSKRGRDPREHHPVSPLGEIHLGPGWRLAEQGALATMVGGRYRANASHNAGILYHEYGHHLTRYTADFQANARREPERQTNRKSAIDEGTSDYFTAVMLGTPHIWAWHQPAHHPRNLASRKTMAAYDDGAEADPHANGTIWAATLWSLRNRVAAPRQFDRLVLAALLLIGSVACAPSQGRSLARRIRSSFATGLSALLRADQLLTDSRYQALIVREFEERGISADELALQEALA
jgi:hypothetical protein